MVGTQELTLVRNGDGTSADNKCGTSYDQHAHTGSTGNGKAESTIVRSILDRGLQGVVVISRRVGLEDLEGDRASLELEAFGSLGLNEAVPTGVGDLLVVCPVVVAQAIDDNLTVCVGHVGGNTGGAQLRVQGCVNRVEVLGGSALRRALKSLDGVTSFAQ